MRSLAIGAQVNLALADNETALELAEKALELSRTSGDNASRISALLVKIEILLLHKNYVALQPLFIKIWQLSLGEPAKVRVLITYAKYLYKIGDHNNAFTILQWSFHNKAITAFEKEKVIVLLHTLKRSDLLEKPATNDPNVDELINQFKEIGKLDSLDIM